MLSAYQTRQNILPLNAHGEPIKLPENLESLPKAELFPKQRHRWNTNEEIAAILISFDHHSEWQSKEVKIRPRSGSMLLYSRKKVRYRRDGYCWKKRKDGKTTREDHMKLKVQGTECIYGCYVHSAILPTFHRRCYWLLQNPDIVLVHYLNVPYPDDNKISIIAPNLALWSDKKEWTKDELITQLKPMFFNEDEPDANNDLEISNSEAVENLVSRMMEKQSSSKQSAIVKHLECGCPDSTYFDGKSCSHQIRKAISKAKNNNNNNMNNNNESTQSANLITASNTLSPRSSIENQVSSTTEFSNSSRAVKRSALSTFQQPQPQPQPQPQHRSPVSIKNQTGTYNNQQLQSNQSQQQPQPHHQQQPLNDRNSTSLIFSLSQLQGNNSLLIFNNSAQATQNSPSNRPQQHMTPLSYVSHNTHGTNRQKVCFKSTKCENNDKSSASAAAAAIATATAEIDVKTKKELLLVNHLKNNHNNTTSTNSGGNSSSSNSSGGGSGGGSSSSSNGGVNSNNNSCGRSIDGNINGNSNDQSNHNKNQNELSSESLNQNNEMLNFHKVPMNHNEIFSSANNTSNNNEIVLIDGSKSNIHIHNHTNDNGNHHFLTNTIVLLDTNQKNSMFSETMEMSEDELQKTLLANISSAGQQHSYHNNSSNNNNNINPSNENNNSNNDGNQRSEKTSKVVLNQKSQHKIVQTIDMDNIEFMEHCDKSMEHSAHVVDDDVFVNLDAFDILGEFPDLEVFNSDHHDLMDTGHRESVDVMSDNAMEHLNAKGPFHHGQLSASEGSVEITDYSPEWAYPEGGVKVLVTGPWYSSSTYTVFFDTFPVPTTLVQNGVLRCYCPAHEVGLATLQVACDGFMISNSVIFEYKFPPHETIHKIGDKLIEVNNNENLLKFTLMQKLETIDQTLHIKQEPESSESTDDSMNFMRKEFEDNLLDYCQKIWQRNQNYKINEHLHEKRSANFQNMTLLHLAVALGYSKLVQFLLEWPIRNPSLLLQQEINAFSLDDNGFTPLMWACYHGHTEMAIRLLNWTRESFDVKNSYFRSALEIAKDNQHFHLEKQLQAILNDSTTMMTAATNINHQTNECFLMLYEDSLSPLSPDVFNNFQLARRSSVDSGINMNSDYSSSFHTNSIYNSSTPTSPELSLN